MKNKSFLLTFLGHSGIYTHKRTINYHFNADWKKVEYTTDLKNYGILCSNNSSIEYIILMDRVTGKFHARVASEVRNVFLIRLPNTEVIFQIVSNRLNFHDTANSGVVLDSLCYSRASVHTVVCLPYVRGLEPVCVRRYACHTYVD